MHIEEGPDVEFFDRVMCMDAKGPTKDDRGFVKLHFPDNGYENYVDPSKVFHLDNHEEINRVPIQVSDDHETMSAGVSSNFTQAQISRRTMMKFETRESGLYSIFRRQYAYMP